jgi:ABC-2 type transport system permease protein
MYSILTLALKDLRLLCRDWFGLFWIFVFPLLFALLLGAVFGGGEPGGNPISVAVINEDRSDRAREFIARLQQKKDALRILSLSRHQAREGVRKGDLVAFVVLKPGFGKSDGFFAGQPPVIEVGIDPRRRPEAEYLKGLLMETAFQDIQTAFSDPRKSRAQIDKAKRDIKRAKNLKPKERQALQQLFTGLDRFFTEVDAKTLKAGPQWQAAKIEQVEITPEGGKPLSGFEITFPSAILWGLMGCVAAFAISIVTERVAGTLLRLRIAPLSRGQLLAGKGLACFLASTAVAVFLLVLGHLLFGVRLANPVGLVLAVLSTAGCFVGIMMLLSTLGNTEQGVAGAGWGIMTLLAMLGGGMVPLIAMPGWMQTASNFSPIKWGILALEGSIWRDFTLAEMLVPCGILVAVGVVCFALGVWSLARRED